MNKFFSTLVFMTSFTSSLTSFAEIYKPKTVTLKNGLHIVIVENHLAPVVSLSLYYKVGTADDPVHMVGLSHFLEHLMFKGTKHVPSGEFKKKITSKGGNINAYTSFDITAYTCTIAVSHLPMVLEMEADRMQNLVFDEKETKAEQRVVMEERRMRMDNSPLGGAQEVFLRALYRYHPYGVPPIGYPHHIEAYTNEAAKAHYQTWYRPNNAILVISGDIKMETLLPLIQKYFDPIPMGEIPKRQRFQEPQASDITQTLTIRNPRVSYTSLDWSYKAPNHLGEGKEHYYPLIVLAHLLGGNEISRLYKELVDHQKLCLDVSVDYPLLSLDPMSLTISATLAPEKGGDVLETSLNTLLRTLLEKGVTEEELHHAKRDLLADVAFARDGNDNAVQAFSALAYGMSVEEVESSSEKINAVTLDQVNKAIQAVFKRGAFIKTIISPDQGDENKK